MVTNITRNDSVRKKQQHITMDRWTVSVEASNMHH